MLKKYILSIALGAALIGATSCDNQLDLQPEQSLSTELAFSDALAARGSALGVYSLAQVLDVYGSMPQIIGDFQSDNVDFIGSFPTLQDIRLYDTRSDNGSISTIWSTNYRVILAANAVIANMPNVPDASLSQDERTQLVAEARFVRALIYRQLLDLFAQPEAVAGPASDGVPLVVDPFVGEVDFPARASVGEVNNFIRTELEAIIDDLPDSHGGVFAHVRATKAAARALLARHHLYLNEFTEAGNYAQQVIDDPVTALAPNHNFWGSANSTPEDIFAIFNSEIDNGRTGSGGWASFYNPAENNARGDCPFSADLVALFEAEPGDARFDDLTQVGQNGRVYTTKFPDAINNTDNSPVLRVTEMYLTVAEVQARAGNSGAALDIVNQLRDRAGLPALSGLTGQDLINQVLVERRKELCFEGTRRMDLLRLNLPLRPAGNPQFDRAQPGADKTILPIPQRERDINPNLTQNTGY
ncbi:MAG: RagB/SusD family nutrient uptake outer membrane protein [Cyclobacteriaceae bacterium]|nr:RagB/SusD family nutrient uptake outer membrane protein [Cyclobacteriaceae bacterium]MCH8517667.1 RagB/SusD family nutrient uptake outer membrane protein [Cyclobacteriaceae bacterium]